MLRVVCSIIAVLVLAACSATPPAAPSFARNGGSTAQEGVVQSVSGSAHRIRPLPDGELWVLTFNAEKRADGSVVGQAHVDRKDLEAAWDIEVTCMAVTGNRAWIAGIVRNARGAIPRDGTVSYFWVTDNGEGGPTPDRASGIRINDTPGQDQVFCTLQPTFSLPDSDIAHGNVQVR
jgi:hypothetical protein